MNQDRPQTLIDAPLGEASSYPERYDASLLFPIERAAGNLATVWAELAG